MAWFSPYVLADGQVDTRSLDSILADGRFAGKQGEELAVALWTWLVDRREGFYHFLAGTEEPGETLTADPVKDPLRLLNSYGYGLCGNVAMLFAGLYDWAGGKSRVVGIPGHTISEAYWGGCWHLIDCDLRALHYKKTEQGYEIASLRELVTHPEMVASPVKKSDPYYMSDEHARDIAQNCYRPGEDVYFPPYFYRLGSMDYVLRPGESLTCHYQPQGRFYWGRDWSHWIKDEQHKGFTGPYDKKDPSRRYAAACIRWKPNLQADLKEVGVSCNGFQKAAVGLTARTAEAVVRYRLVSPYVICGRYEGFDPGRKRVDGLLVRLNASGVPVVRIATPRNGRVSQIPLQQEGDEYWADLTEWADLHYEYELTISMPAGATLRGIVVETWCQASAMTLPQWCEPGRQVRLATGSAWKDLQGRAVLPQVVDLIERLRMGEGGARLEKGRLNDSKTRKILPEDGQVTATVAVEPPVASRIVRLHVMAAMASVKDESAAKGEVAIEMATSPEGPFRVLGCRPVQSHPQEFHFSVEGWARLAEPAEKVWLRLRSPQPIGVWRVRMDYEPARDMAAPFGFARGPHDTAMAAGGGRPLEVLFRWRHNGKLRTHSQRLGPGDVDRPFVPVTEDGTVQPMHLVLSVPSNS